MRKNTLFAVLEDDLASTPVAVAPETEIPEGVEPADLVGEGAESAVDASFEVATDEGEIDTINTAMGDGERAIVAIENMIVALEDAAENGGIDEAAAAVMKVGMDAILDNIGANPEEMAEETETPAIEAYGTVSGKLAATTAAIESFKETKDKVWGSIVAAWDKFVAWVKQMWKNFFDGVEKLKNRAQKLDKLIPSVKIDGAKTIESAKLFKSIAVDGKDEGQQCGKLKSLMAAALKSQNSAAHGARGVISAIEAAAAGKAAYDAKMDNAVFPMEGGTKGETTDGVTSYTYTGLPGGAVVTQVVSADTNITPDNISKFATSVAVSAAGEGKSVNALDAGGLKGACSGVLALVGQLEQARAAEREIDGIAKNIKNAINKLKAAKVEGDEAKQGISGAKKLATGSRTLLASPSVAVAAYVLKAANSQLNLVEQSISAHAGKAAAPAEDKDAEKKAA